ncbi:MAG: DUF3043 domain-containing protein [Bifidobacteriaceae bacterium]|jgi:hypothetical protein|nr:DUF3043 domain-containing protein [Bifidobacteriaceae bacterium]
MPLFKKKSEPELPAQPVKVVGKKVPTPKRKEAEAQNIHPIIVKDRKAAKRQAREIMARQRDEETAALRSGDINKMPLKDRGEEKLFVRNYVDSQFELGELFLPIAIVLLISLFTPGLTQNGQIAAILVLSVYGFLLACAIEVAFRWYFMKKAMFEHFGPNFIYKGKGLLNYMMMRILQFRRMRLPKPLPREEIKKYLAKGGSRA